MLEHTSFRRPPTPLQPSRFDTPPAPRPGITLKQFILQEAGEGVLIPDADYQMILTESQRLADKAAGFGFRTTPDTVHRIITNIWLEAALQRRAALLSDD